MVASASKLLEAIAALIWPLLVAILVWKLFPAIRGIVTSRNFSVKVGGIELSVQDATEQIRTQIEDLQKQVILLRSARRGEGSALAMAAEEDPLARAESARKILWVDDRPSNNAFEIAQLRKRDVDVVQVLSTEEALDSLGSGASFAAVISDMGRMEDGRYQAQAGLSLLQAMKSSHIGLPFMVYTSARSAAREDSAVRAAGGNGATASPTTLMEWISMVLKPGP